MSQDTFYKSNKMTDPLEYYLQECNTLKEFEERYPDEFLEEDSRVGNYLEDIISTHSPILMAFPGATILELGDHGIRAVDYRQTEHYECTRRFLENPERMLQMLLAD